MVNQRDIVNRIADKTGLYKKDIKEMLLAFKEVMVDVIEEDVFAEMSGKHVSDCLKHILIYKK